jgi:hypothetical protein
MLIQYTIYQNEIIQTTSCINIHFKIGIRIHPQTHWSNQNLLLVQ